MARVTVVGSLNADLVVQVSRRPRPGETVFGSDLKVWPGGKGANQAVAAARMGASVSMVGLVGDDPFGDMLVSYLNTERIDTAHVGRVGGSSGTAQIVLDSEGQNTIVVSPGANGRVTPSVLEKSSEVLLGADLILAQHEIPEDATGWLIRFCARNGRPLLLNPAPARAIAPDLLRQIALFAPNESETEFYTGVGVVSAQDAATAARRLHELGVRGVIITMGEKGAFWSCEEEQVIAPAYRVRPVDTTAAGDCFIGALAARSGGLVSKAALKTACAAAAISVTRPGAQPSMPVLAEVERFIREAGEGE